MTDQLKLQLIQQILNTDDLELLQSISKMFELKRRTTLLEGPDDFIAQGLGLEGRQEKGTNDDIDDLQASSFPLP